jgi:hypothetical protein
MTQQDEVKRLSNRLKKLGPYTLKGCTSIGYWVDGRFGYLVGTDYYDTQAEALDMAIQRIETAIRQGKRPGWRFLDEDIT